MAATPQQDTTPPFDGPKLLKILKEADKNFPARYEFWNHQARVLKVRHNLLLEHGFSDDQALRLITQDWGRAI